MADAAFQDHSMRFLENHDEPRAADGVPPARDAQGGGGRGAVTARGLRFFYEGEFEGRRVHVSMHLGRRPWEPVDDELRAFYGRLLEVPEAPRAARRRVAAGGRPRGVAGQPDAPSS